MEGPYSGGATGKVEFAVTFVVSEIQDFELSAYSFMVGDMQPGRPIPEFTFAGANSGSVLGVKQFFLNYNEPSLFTGILVPHTYTFLVRQIVSGGFDPLGDHSEGEWDMRLSVSNAVPDAGPSALLLGVGLVGLLAFGGRRVAA